MVELIVYLISIVVGLLTLIMAFFWGNHIEKKHYANILERERKLHHIIVVAIKRPPSTFQDQQLVKGSVVVSSDKFRRFLAKFRHFFGGNVRSYETLLDRARREAILRMKEEAAQLGANAILNVKLETVSLDDIHNARSRVSGTVEVLAYGTAGRIVKK